MNVGTAPGAVPTFVRTGFSTVFGWRLPSVSIVAKVLCMADIDIKEARVFMRDERFVMLTSTNPEGQLYSYPMTPQEVTDNAEIWFFIGDNSDQAEALKKNPKCNISFANKDSWLSAAGVIEFVDDKAKADELWDDGVADWFDGRDDPTLALVKFTTEHTQLWGRPTKN